MNLLLVSCNRIAALPPGAVSSDAPAGFECPAGTSWTVEAPEHESLRALAGTEVHTRRDAEGRPVGPHLERWPDGGTACLGAWVDGDRDGVWLSWHPDGAFRSQITWAKGHQHGPRREVGLEGRVVELAMEDGGAPPTGSSRSRPTHRCRSGRAVGGSSEGCSPIGSPPVRAEPAPSERSLRRECPRGGRRGSLHVNESETLDPLRTPEQGDGRTHHVEDRCEHPPAA